MAPCPPEKSQLIHSLTAVWNRGGWIGVDLFFVLSGFLVSGLLFKEYEANKRISGGRFLIRRGFKIYPGFWFLILAAILVSLRRHTVPSGGQLAAELLFFQNYQHGLLVHTWSLAVEEHFYMLLVGLLAWLSTRSAATNPFRLVPWCICGVAIACLGMRLYAGTFPFDLYRNLFPTHLRIDSLAFGVLLSYLNYRNPVRFYQFATRYRWYLIAIGCALLAPAFMDEVESTPFLYTGGLTLLYLGSGCLLMGALGMPVAQPGRWAPLASMGFYSYSIYLWHLAVLTWVMPAIAVFLPWIWSWFIYFPFYVVGALCLGIGMARLIEVPMLRLRDTWFPSRSGSAVQFKLEAVNA